MSKVYFKFENYPHRDFPVYSSVRENVEKIFGMHYHRDGEFLKVVKGKVRVNCGKCEFTLKENDIVFFAPNTIHGGDAQTEVVRTHAITFDPLLLGNMVDFSDSADSHIIFDNNNREVNESFDKVFDAYRSDKPTAKIRIMSGLMLLSGILAEKGFINCRESLSKKRTLPVIEYIKENYNQEITLEEMAVLMNFCPNHFIRIFKEENQKTPFEYIADYRIEKSLQLLSQNKYSVSEIAGMIGFSDSAHFIKVFRKKLGITPGKYRNYKL